MREGREALVAAAHGLMWSRSTLDRVDWLDRAKPLFLLHQSTRQSDRAPSSGLNLEAVSVRFNVETATTPFSALSQVRNRISLSGERGLH